MAKTNRNRKLPLREAWQHYWPQLFGGIWRDELASAVKMRIALLDKAPRLGGSLPPDTDWPEWAEDVTVRVEDLSVTVEVQGASFGPMPLFYDQVGPAIPAGADGHPWEVADLHDGLEASREQLARAAVFSCGGAIRSELLSRLRAESDPMFEIYCRPANDALAQAKRLPTSAVGMISSIDVQNNVLLDRMGFALFIDVQIKNRAASPKTVGAKGSFHVGDDILIEDMREIIEKDPSISVREAATRVMNKANRRGGSSDESVISRLERKFGKEYPGYRQCLVISAKTSDI